MYGADVEFESRSVNGKYDSSNSLLTPIPRVSKVFIITSLFRTFLFGLRLGLKIAGLIRPLFIAVWMYGAYQVLLSVSRYGRSMSFWSTNAVWL